MVTLGDALKLAIGMVKARGVNPEALQSLAPRASYRPPLEDEPERARVRLRPDAPADNDLHLPVRGRVSSRFGPRVHPVTGKVHEHRGVDIAAPAGTPITAMAGGRVVHAGWIRGYGLTIILDHGDGVTSLYAHMRSLSVNVGATVERAAILGQVGQTGLATGPHLHFEVRRHGRAVDPSVE